MYAFAWSDFQKKIHLIATALEIVWIVPLMGIFNTLFQNKANFFPWKSFQIHEKEAIYLNKFDG